MGAYIRTACVCVKNGDVAYVAHYRYIPEYNIYFALLSCCVSCCAIMYVIILSSAAVARRSIYTLCIYCLILPNNLVVLNVLRL